MDCLCLAKTSHKPISLTQAIVRLSVDPDLKTCKLELFLVDLTTVWYGTQSQNARRMEHAEQLVWGTCLSY